MTAPALEVRLKVTAAHGRLYVAGPSHQLASRVPGAAFNQSRHAYEIPWTLESLKALRKATRLPFDQFSAFCTEDVLKWAHAAHESEQRVAEAQRKIASGWRPTGLEWQDNSGKPYRRPYDHQQIMTAVGLLLDGSANLSQMGVGKSRSLSEIISYQLRHNEIDLAIIVAPKGVVGTWAREAPIWSDRFRIHRLGFRPGRKTEAPVAERKQHLRTMAEVPYDPKGFPNVILINYDVVFQLEEELVALCKRFRVGLYPDEMHRISNPQAKVTKTFLKLAPLAARRVGMTGTPVKDKTGEGLWSQWYFIDLGTAFGANYVSFSREWFTENPWTHERTPKDGALEEMGQRIARRSVRFLKQDCMDLPDKVYVRREVELTAEQRKAYDEMKRDLLTELGPEDGDETLTATAATQMAAIMRLSQITSGYLPAGAEGTIHRFTPNPKLDALLEIVEEQIDQQQIVVWAYFRADHDLLAAQLAKFKPVVLRGGMTPSQQDTVEVAFQTGQSRLLIGQQQAAGVGRNFQAGSLVIYYSQQYSIVDREQSEDRTHRGGSEIHKKITYIDLVAAGTVDEDVSAGLQEKKTVQEVVVDMKRRLRGW